MFGVEFAPMSVPMDRRLQTAAVAQWVFALFFMPVMITPVLVYVLMYTTYWWIVALYGAWMYYDWDSSKNGGYRYPIFASSVVWKYFRDYFPATLKKTAEISPENNYIFCCHPHGIISHTLFCNIGTNATGFDRLFPGINRRMLTLKSNFMWPIRREYFLMLGGCDVSKESIHHILSQPGKGNACVIVVGGAEEALDAHPGSYDLTLKKRKGFIKQALIHGAHLVPVFSFGENDLYEQVSNERGSAMRSWQIKIKDILGFSPPLFRGRGIFNYSFGLLPFRRPVQTVVGKPIAVTKVEDPSRAQIEELHSEYMKQLETLFETNKKEHAIAEDVKLHLY